MKRLILMRHAEAGWHINMDDHERPLSASGIRDAKKIGSWLKEKEYIPDEVISSTSVRTRETLSYLFLECPQIFEKSLYLADAEQMKSTLKTLLSETVILLAHNPGITELAHDLMNHEEKHENFMDFPAASTLVIDFKADRWSEVKSDSGIFVDFVMPLQL
ncbi:MAG: histidine phosphatase family protein [Rhodobacterales bacterium]|nr:histidine phosphatase family protein [Rhodobacterales bacterium]